MEFNIDVQDVLKQIKFSDILEYLTESYDITRILDGIDDITFDKYVWTSCEDRKPFANAVVYCIYIDKSCNDQVCKARYCNGKFIDENTLQPIKDVVRWTYQPYFG